MKLNLELVQGVTQVIPVVARATDGTPLNLTGLTGSAINWLMAAAPNLITAPNISLTIGSGIVLTAPIAGLFTITITPANTLVLYNGEYIHQCLLTVGGVTYLPLWGNAILDGLIGNTAMVQ